MSISLYLRLSERLERQFEVLADEWNLFVAVDECG